MTVTITSYIWTYLYDFLLIGSIGVLQKIGKLSIETSRKLIHILLSFTWLFLYYLFWPSWQIVVVPITFILINYLSYKFKLFKMIERESDEGNHKGTIYFAIAISALMGFALLFPSTIMHTGIAVFCLCFGDGFAALFGTMFKKRIMLRKSKSLQGTVACFVGTFVGLMIFSLSANYAIPWYGYLALAGATSALELIEHGLDNFSITAGTYMLAVVLLR